MRARKSLGLLIIQEVNGAGSHRVATFRRLFGCAVQRVGGPPQPATDRPEREEDPRNATECPRRRSCGSGPDGTGLHRPCARLR